MRGKSDWGPDAIVWGLGSLWLAVVLLVLILVGMACATIFESTHGSEQALAIFYRSWWFVVLLGLLAINVGVAAWLRFPLSKRQIGFAVTHGSILVVLAGALVTEWLGVRGQVSFFEGDTVEHLDILRDTLFLTRRSDETQTTADLGDLPSGGLRPLERPAVPSLNLDDVRVEVARYVPDSVASQKVVNNGPQPRLAVEVSFSDPHGRSGAPAWVFAGQTARLGSLSVLLREVDEEALRRLSAQAPEKPQPETESVGSVRVDYQGLTFEFPVEQCTDGAVPLGETGYSLRVLRYMPDARVGAGNQLVNASDQPVNPTIEVELSGPEGTVKRPAFAKFPEFWSTHGPKGTPGLKITFLASSDEAPRAPISVLSGPDGKLYARFARQGQPVVIKELTIGRPCESPWAGLRLTVLRRFDHADVQQSVTSMEPVHKNRVPAVLLDVKTPSGTESVWLQRYRSYALTVNGSTYDLIYGNQRVPLGFSVTLKDFQIGYFPGTRRPRSFESQVSIRDPASGRTLNRVISMNHPTAYGGYTFYQSSYRQMGQRMISTLSVSRDPGQPLVFLGYLGMLAGMLLVLGRRIAEGRGPAGRPAKAGIAEGGRSKPKSSNR